VSERLDQSVSTEPLETISVQPSTRRMWFARLAKLLAVATITIACAAFGFGVYFVIAAGDSVKLIWDGLLSLFIATAYAIVGMLVAS